MSIIETIFRSKSIGFLTLHEASSDDYMGAYLITDFEGLPKEFRCTHSIKPDDVQKALYGDALLSYIGVELCGKPLIQSSKNRPRIIIVDKSFLLKLSDHSSYPVAFVNRVENGDKLTDIEEYGSEYQIERMKSNHYEDETLEIVKKKEDNPHSSELMKKLCYEFDIFEPFDRMLNAIESLRQKSSRFR